MSIFELLLRIFDNILWMVTANNPFEIVNAIFNILQLITENLFL